MPLFPMALVKFPDQKSTDSPNGTIPPLILPTPSTQSWIHLNLADAPRLRVQIQSHLTKPRFVQATLNPLKLGDLGTIHSILWIV